MRFKIYSTSRNQRGWLLMLLLAAGWLMGCAGQPVPPTPLLIRPAEVPVMTTAVPLTGPVVEALALPLTENPTAVSDEPTPYALAAVGTAIPPTPVGSGVRPQQAQQLRPPDAAFDSPVDWRPPPLPVPLSLHPDDHYWLIRPIPSSRRNFDLEWYPYGNDVLVASLGPYRVHHGLDFPNDTGTPILAAASGTVIHAGPFPSNRDGVNYYGNTVIVQHDWQWLGKDVFTLYAHTLELFVEVGDYVNQGQLLAGVGASGEVSGPHLHLEVRVGLNNYNETRNPMLWLAPYEGWGTLAGRFVDNRGRMIQGALVTVEPLNVNTPRRVQRTYMSNLVKSDDIWRENFVVGDLPAGRYKVTLSVAGETFQRNVDVQPGRTNFIAFEADFAFFPTVTPTPTIPAPTATATPEE